MFGEVDQAFERDAPGWICIGIHPWEADECPLPGALKTIDQLAGEGRLLAVGEAGVDRRNGKLPVPDQMELFAAHTEIAHRHGLPLIIHSVRAHADILSVRKEFKKNVWMIHGFLGNGRELDQCLKHDIRISPGISLLLHMGIGENHKFFSLLKEIPPGSLFLESDGVSLSIEEIYRIFSRHTEMDPGELRRIIELNFHRDFFREKVSSP